MAAAALIAVLRVVVAGHGHVGSLILVGSQFGNPAHVPRGVPVTSGSGYDGQFYYRMALDPGDFARQAFGITLDNAGRLQRIAYPALAWLVAAGRAAAVPWSLLVVNVVAYWGLGAAGAAFARANGRHPLWGLLLVGYFGFLWSLARDLTEMVAAAFLMAGLLAIRRDRRILAAMALAVSVLARETGMVVVACLAMADLLTWWRGPRRSWSDVGRDSVAWLCPAAVFFAWQLVVSASVGSLPLRLSGRSNLGWPLAGLARGVAHYVPRLPHIASLLWCGELLVLAVAVVSAAQVFGKSAARLHERMAWVALVALTLCVSSGVWLGDVGFRSLYDVYAFSFVLIVSSPRPLRAVPAVVGVAWAVVAVELVLFI